MSNALAIAAATATLRSLLETQVPVLAGVSGFELTTQPLDVASQNKKDAQLNLFLYQTVINSAWRNLDMPRQVRPGETGAPPLSLNLHYLITAYGRGGADKDIVSDRVLGGAMSVLHDHPVLGREEIRNVLEASELHEQFERLRITPLPMGLEEMSKLWMVFQTQYRISAAYEVTVVLIDSRRPVPAALPVLKRGKQDRGVTAVAGAAPSLREIRLPRSQPAARLGEDIAIVGEQLTVVGTTVRFTSTRDLPPIVREAETGPTPGEIAVHIPNDAQALFDWAPGFYTVAVVQQRSDVPPIVSNELPFALAPRIDIANKIQSLDGEFKKIELTLTCEPRVLVGQRVLLLFGDRQFAARSIDTPQDPAQPTTLAFIVRVPKDTVAEFVVRLRVDGADSIPVAYTGAPPLPSFDPAQKVVVT
jgi:hypothetical protein